MRSEYLLVLTAIFVQGCSHGPGSAGKPQESALPAAKPPPKVNVIPVETQTVPNGEVIAPARLETNPNRVAHVMLPIPGRITAVLSKMGDAVEEGQPLLEIESPDAEEAQSSFLEAEAALTHDHTAASKAQADLDRLTDLLQHGAIARKDVLAARNTLTLAQASVEQSRAGRERAARRLQLYGLKPGVTNQRVKVRSPIAGKILAIQVAAGEYRNDISTSVLTIADLSKLWVTSEIPESAIRFCQVGGRVDIELLAFPGEVFHGTVAQIAATLDPETRTIKVHADFQNAGGRFRPEMFGQVRYLTGTWQAPVIPESAVIQSGDKTFVYREDAPGRYQPVPVTLGKRFGNSFPVLAGVSAGDRIVTDGAIYLKAGS